MEKGYLKAVLLRNGFQVAFNLSIKRGHGAAAFACGGGELGEFCWMAADIGADGTEVVFRYQAVAGIELVKLGELLAQLFNAAAVLGGGLDGGSVLLVKGTGAVNDVGSIANAPLAKVFPPGR